MVSEHLRELPWSFPPPPPPPQSRLVPSTKSLTERRPEHILHNDLQAPRRTQAPLRNPLRQILAPILRAHAQHLPRDALQPNPPLPPLLPTKRSRDALPLRRDRHGLHVRLSLRARRGHQLHRLSLHPRGLARRLRRDEEVLRPRLGSPPPRHHPQHPPQQPSASPGPCPRLSCRPSTQWATGTSPCAAPPPPPSPAARPHRKTTH